MTRLLQLGYTINSDVELASLSTTYLAENTPLVNFARRCWMIYTEAVSTINGFEPIPQNVPSVFKQTNIIITADTYTLDLSTTNQYISLTLTVNTTLTVINSVKYTEYFIEVVPDEYYIKNWTEIFSLPINYSQDTLINSYFGKMILLLQFVNKLYAQILYSDYPSFAEKTTYKKPNPVILRFSFNTTTTAYTGTAISAITTIGSPVIEKARLLLSGGRLQCTKAVGFNFDATDFTISFALQKKVVGNFGCILGSSSLASVGFYCGIDSTSTFYAVFGSITLSVAVPDDLAEHIIVINRFNNVYKLLLDGDIVVHFKAANNNNSLSTEPFCVGSLRIATSLPSWCSQSFQGYLRDVTVALVASTPYPVKDIYAHDLYASSTVLLLKYGVSSQDLAQHSLTRSFTSTVTVEPLLLNGALNKYSHLGYNNTNLQITGDCVFEAVVTNPSGNSRATIIDSAGNFSWGIYDNLLRIQFGSFDLVGVTTIPYDTNVVLTFTRSGNNIKLYIDGVVDNSGTTSEGMNNAGATPEFSIKRAASQDSAISSLNTSLYPSRSWLIIKSLRVSKVSRYNSDYLVPVSFEQ